MDALELKQKTFRSVIWTVVRIGSTSLLTFLVFLILARRLSPMVLGIFALALLCTEFAKTLATAGMEEMITQVPHLDEELADSAFWVTLLLSVVAAAALWGTANPYAHIIGQPAVAPVLRWLCIVVPVWALGVLHMARKARDFGHRAVATRSIACGLLGGGSAIVAAIYGLGVWSLVIQAVVNEVLGAVLSWIAFPWLPRPQISMRRLTAVASFGGGVTVALLLRQVQARMQDLIIGGFLTAAALGTYRIAWRILELISQMTVFPVMSVSLVTLAKLQHDPPAFANAYGRMLGLMAAIAFPAIAGFGVLAPDIIIALFGQRWAGSVPIAEILAFIGPPFAFNFFVIPVLISAGRTRASAEMSIVQLVTTAVALTLAVPFGLLGVAVASVVRGYLAMPYQIWILQRETGIKPGVVARNLLPPLWASVSMVVVLLMLRPTLESHIGGRLPDALVGTLVGTAAYLLGLAVFGRRFLVSQYAVLRPLMTAASKDIRAYLGPAAK